jgi:hypothetical protein
LSLTLREENGLTLFENRVLRGISGSKREEVAGGCRRLHTEELQNLHASHKGYSDDKIKEVMMGGARSMTEEMKNEYSFLL